MRAPETPSGSSHSYSPVPNYSVHVNISLTIISNRGMGGEDGGEKFGPVYVGAAPFHASEGRCIALTQGHFLRHMFMADEETITNKFGVPRTLYREYGGVRQRGI